MANTEHLAIASVPMQCWDKVYEEAQALKEGTIFPELNKPFYVTVGDGDLPENNAGISGASITQDNLLLQIQQVSFVLDDLRLFLDTHPQEKQALELLKSMLKKRKILTKEFAVRFYPLTMDCMVDCYEGDQGADCYYWQEGPVPWEGVCV